MLGVTAGVCALVMVLFAGSATAEEACGPSPCAVGGPVEGRLASAVQEPGVLDRATTGSSLALGVVPLGLALVGATLGGVVWRRRSLVFSPLEIHRLPGTGSIVTVTHGGFNVSGAPEPEPSMVFDSTG